MEEILLLAQGTFPEEAFRAFLKECGLPLPSFRMNGKAASLLLEERDVPRLLSSFPAFAEDLLVPIAGVMGGEGNRLLPKLLPSALSLLPGRISWGGEVILKAFSFGDLALLKDLSLLFRGVDPELLRTGEAYLRMNGRGDIASEALFLHRNTLLYRLNRFHEETGLDLRKEQDAFLFALYLGLGS